MKNKLILSFFIAAMVMSLAGIANAASLAQNLSGKILLQVEENGEAWYIYPNDLKRYYLGRPADAFDVMRNLGLGISEANFNGFNGVAPANLAGKILLRVEANGEAYYVHPKDKIMHYLGRPADAFGIMRNFGLGITTINLEKIAASGALPTFVSTIKDCGSSSQSADNLTDNAAFDCFNTYTNACDQVKMNHTQIFDIVGIKATTNTEYQITEKKDGNCEFKLTVGEQSTSYGQVLIDALIDQGQTMTEIQAAEAEVNKLGDAENGTTGFCTMSPSNLGIIIDNWKTKGRSESSKCVNSNCTVSGGDWDYAETCWGDYFGDWSTVPDSTYCSSDYYCADSQECFSNKCISKTVWENLDTCQNITVTDTSIHQGYNACTQATDKKKSGDTYGCITKQRGEEVSYKCGECMVDTSCKDEYKCEEYKCVDK
ncbi:hypothetical protein HQ571_06765 [Candidatus Kuenenbacteria bacterium]|nr:hypothetical protein [Candidatus Kuenenbacteria bacterium]